MNRRTLVIMTVNTVGVGIAGVVVGPALTNVLSPALLSGTDPKWRIIGKLDSFEVGRVHTKEIEGRGVFVWRQAEDTAIVFSRSCTDLGCPLTWDSGSTWFYCPCHGGVFNSEGTPVAGPPKRPLWRYNVRVRDGQLEIDLRSVPPMV